MCKRFMHDDAARFANPHYSDKCGAVLDGIDTLQKGTC